MNFDRQATYKLLLHLQGSLAIDSKNINRSGNQHREIKHNKWLGYGGERERLLQVLTFLSRNFFTDLRDASVDKPKLRFASSISQSANRFFFSSFLVKEKNKNGVGTSIRRSKVALLFSLTWVSFDFFMLSRHIWPAFKTPIPPSFTYRNPLETFQTVAAPF